MSLPLPATLHLDSGRDFRGGQQQVLFLLQHLHSKGARVLLCCPKSGQLFRRAHDAGIPCQPLTIRSGIDFSSSIRLARILNGSAFDLVHAHDSHSHSIARAGQGLTREKALKRNLFVTRRNVAKGHGAIDRIKYSNDGIHYIAISNAVRDRLAKQGIPKESIAVVPSGVEIGRLKRLREQPTPDPWGLRDTGKKIIGTIGHMTKEKNHLLLVESFALLHQQMPDTHLLIVGSGPLRKTVEKRVDDLSLREHATLTGHLEDVNPALRALDVFALSSDMEGLCTSLLAAMAAGIPVASTAAGGVLMIARHGLSALVVPPRDQESLAGAMKLLLQQSDLAESLIQGGQKMAENYSVENMIEGTLRAYSELSENLSPDEGP